VREPLVWPATAVTVSVAVVLAPELRFTESGARDELIFPVSPLSLFVSVKVSLGQPVSLFVIVTM
jgi:hypothetical protein